MATKKACVVHTPAKKTDAEAVRERLSNDGYSVCLTEVSASEANAVEAGDRSSLPVDVRECLEGAEICVILVDDVVGLGAIGGLASDMGCEVMTVGGSPEDLPDSLDDVTDGHVPTPDAPQLEEIVQGKPEMIRPDNTRAKPRDSDRVKCQ